MRLVAMVTAVTLLAYAPASGQAPASVQHPYGLDPFKPSDAAWLRNYGSALVAQTPLLELRRLDPYKPSHAALLRDLGGAIPLWPLWYPWAPVPAPLIPFSTSMGVMGPETARVTILVDGQVPSGNASRNAAAAVPLPLPKKVVGALRPETNAMWISYAGGRWISAGPAVLFDEAAFVRIGEYHSFPVFRRIEVDDDVIYLPTRGDLVAPYRLKVR